MAQLAAATIWKIRAVRLNPVGRAVQQFQQFRPDAAGPALQRTHPQPLAGQGRRHDKGFLGRKRPDFYRRPADPVTPSAQPFYDQLAIRLVTRQFTGLAAVFCAPAPTGWQISISHLAISLKIAIYPTRKTDLAVLLGYSIWRAYHKIRPSRRISDKGRR